MIVMSSLQLGQGVIGLTFACTTSHNVMQHAFLFSNSGIEAYCSDQLASFRALTLLVGSSGLQNHPQNDLLCVEWDIEPLLPPSNSVIW